MKDVIYKTLGRASLCFDRIRQLLASNNKRNGKEGKFDKTGLVVDEVKALEVLWKDDELTYVKYDSFAHSFWRAQEFSLYEKYRDYLNAPLLDFGCGDGSFSSVLFKKINYGVDNDPEALAKANKFDIYEHLLQSFDSTIPLENDSIKSVISNSVLEHVVNLDRILFEISRILKKDGIFMFSAPIKKFKEDLAKYFGIKESENINLEYCHRNLLSIEEWVQHLEKHGFSIVVCRTFQPDWFTFWYRMFRLLGRRGLGLIFPWINDLVWKIFCTTIVNMVKSSLNETKNGANLFVIAKKGLSELEQHGSV